MRWEMKSYEMTGEVEVGGMLIGGVILGEGDDDTASSSSSGIGSSR